MTAAGSEAASGVAAVLQLLDHRYLSEHVLGPHQKAREEFRVRELTVASSVEFSRAVAAYVQHHERATRNLTLTHEEAHGLAIEVLREAFPAIGYADGYEAALAAGLGIKSGGMPDVVNALARGLRERALRHHVEAVFHTHVDVLSASSCRELAEALCKRYGQAFRRLGVLVDEVLIAQDPRRALLRIREVLDRVLVQMEIS